MKTLAILFLLTATNLCFAYQAFEECHPGTDATYELESEDLASNTSNSSQQ